MSVEIKCDRCGKPVEPGSDATPMTSRVSNNNFDILRNGKLEMRDLCDDCMDKLDLFMQSGKMWEIEYKPDGLAYLELPNPLMSVYEIGQERKPEILISAELEPVNRLIDGYGIADLPLCAVEQVILGVKLR